MGPQMSKARKKVPSSMRSWLLWRSKPPSGITAVVLIGIAACSCYAKDGYVAHEWGTFTSVQGGDGVLLDWRPLQTSQLPKFVYNWQNPGARRQASSPLLFAGKGGMVTLQRMETPVIYFYSDENRSVDVSVRFPQGLITEWYPQANQIGPAVVPVPPMLARLDSYAHNAGVKPQFSLASLLPGPVFADSRIRWQLEILAGKDAANQATSLPLDHSGSHYFAARETAANFISVKSLLATNPAPEHEKFLFYRGAGSFATPLRVTMNERNEITAVNTGIEPIEHLFILSLKNGKGELAVSEKLSPGKDRTFSIDPGKGFLSQEALTKQTAETMAAALEAEGLYRKEAVAMVNTWKDSWFAEDGVRVLYLLPRAWTDRTLPINLNPEPGELVRVMVGRAEVLTPGLEHQLVAELTKAKSGDDEARSTLTADLKKLGRFAEPALRLAVAGQSPAITQVGWAALQR